MPSAAYSASQYGATNGGYAATVEVASGSLKPSMKQVSWLKLIAPLAVMQAVVTRPSYRSSEKRNANGIGT